VKAVAVANGPLRTAVPENSTSPRIVAAETVGVIAKLAATTSTPNNGEEMEVIGVLRRKEEDRRPVKKVMFETTAELYLFRSNRYNSTEKLIKRESEDTLIL
jgi:hypothetical protein